MFSKQHSVVSVILHKDWNNSDYTVADIALIKLKTKVRFTLNKGGFIEKKNSILPGCLPSRRIRNNLYNKKVFVAGNRCVNCLICMDSVYTEGPHIMQFVGHKNNVFCKQEGLN